MSSPHPTISAWERDPHEGHFQAELHGWQLSVGWTPNQGAKRGSFHWIASHEDQSHHSEEHFEEMELAMADAERFAHEKAERAAYAIAAASE